MGRPILSNRLLKSAAFMLSAFAATIGAQFVGPVSLVENGIGAEISFTVNSSTDVEAAVLDKEGRVVRHLAAGVLGGAYPPPEPLQNALSQRLTWDGLDDYGQRNFNEPFSVRVRAGVTPVFARSISIRVFPSNRAYGPGGVDPKFTYLSRQHPLFTDSTLYEEDNPLDITVSDATDEVFVKLIAPSANSGLEWANLARFNGKTGAFNGMMSGFVNPGGLCFYPWWGEPRVSWDGRHIYYAEGSFNKVYCGATLMGNVARYSVDGGLAPWGSTGLSYVSGFYNGDQHSRGISTGADGSLYVLHYQAQNLCPNCTLVTLPSNVTTGYADPTTVSRIKDGRVVKPNLVSVYGAVSCVRTDFKGNIYVGARIKPVGKAVPDDVILDSLSGAYNRRYSQAFWADEMYGSIVKFDSTGGEITVFDTSGKLLSQTANPGDFEGGSGRTLVEPTRTRPQDKVRVNGAGFKWAHFGLSHVLTHTSWRGFTSTCWCNVTRFDVDGYGRVFYPNTFMHEICAIDNNRNVLYRLKNRDIPEVAIGLGQQIEATDYGIYVADWFNNQVAVFRFAADAETTLTLSSAPAEEAPGLQKAGLWLGPNPFSGTVRISARTSGPEAGVVRVVDVSGKTVRRLALGRHNGGLRRLLWDGLDNAGRPAAPGVYAFVHESVYGRAAVRGLLVR